MNAIFDSLVKAKENNLIVEVSIQQRAGTLIGKVQNCSEDYLLLESISSNGINDGFIVIFTNEICCVDLETNRSKKIFKLYNLKSQSHNLVPLISDDYFFNLLQFAKENNLLTEFDCFNNEGYFYDQGFVSDVSDFVSIKSIDDFGKSDGTKIIKMGNISRLYCDGCSARDIKLLYEKNN